MGFWDWLSGMFGGKEEEEAPPEPLVLRAEITTTKSILICKKSGQAIRAVKSGQDGAYAQKYSEKIKFTQ